MYKVLLVDDEPWVIESIKGKVDWEQHGFVVAGQALNGFEALERIAEAEPDVVFTDIRMPGISGLELIQKAKERKRNIHFIIISGYAEFA
jgi:two-component system response regulator YesN